MSDDVAPAEPPPEWAVVPGDRYRIIRLIGSGAQAQVLLAHHIHLDQPCVIKVGRRGDDDWDRIAAARLRAEAQAGSRVQHPNVARVFDCDCADGVWYVVMEFVPGANLRLLVEEQQSLCADQVIDIAVQAADGLAAIHDAQLVHRDIKPGNLMMADRARIKITDLGLVKAHPRGNDMSLTFEGQMLGTPYYMPPEQFEAGAPLDHRADIYALGATMFHLLVGRPPHRGTGLLDLVRKAKHDPIVWPKDAQPGVPRWLRQVVETCLAKHPEHRYEHATELVEALRHGESWRRRLLRPGSAPGSGPPEPDGIMVIAFRNLSRRPDDEWIGDAIAEYLTNRLMELEGLHIADRHSLTNILARRRDADLDDVDPDHRQLIEAAQLVGAGTVINGSFQRCGKTLRLTAYALTSASCDPTPLANLSGPAEELFRLEDALADKVVELAGRPRHPLRQRHGGAGGTANLAAHENFIRGKRLFLDGNYREAIARAEEALALDPDYLDPVSLIGVCYARRGEYDRAVEYHERQEHRAREVGDHPGLAEALANLGVMYYYRGEYATAHEFLDQAKNLCVRLKLPSDAAKHWGNLGFVLMRLQRFDAAEQAFREAIAACKNCGDLVALIWPYNGMGSVLLRQQRVSEAREYYDRALLLAGEVSDRVNVGVSHMNLGRCAALLGDSEEAEHRFNIALETLNGTDFWNGLTLVYEHLAEMHLRIGQPERAAASIDKRIDLARRHGNNRMESAAWEQKARAFELMKRSDDALVCLKQSVEALQRPPAYESLHRYLEELTSVAPDTE